MRRASIGVSLRTPTKERCRLDPHQGQWPLEPFILAGEWERANMGVDAPRKALSHSPANGEIAKGLAHCRRSRVEPRSGSMRLLTGSRAEPSCFRALIRTVDPGTGEAVS
jgi:hypothetical protein